MPDGNETERLKNGEVKQLRQTVLEMEEKVNRMHDVLFGEDTLDDRTGIDDIRLMRQIYSRFKSARFIFGAVAGVLTFLATAGWAIYKIIQILMTIFKAKGGG